MFIDLSSFDSFIDIINNETHTEYWETSAYIKSIFKKYLKSPNKDFSKQSITLIWQKAKEVANFETFQDIGDWTFFTRTMFPESISCSPELYDTFGQTSYYRCYRYLNGQWPLYEELADKFKIFVENIQENLNSI